MTTSVALYEALTTAPDYRTGLSHTRTCDRRGLRAAGRALSPPAGSRHARPCARLRVAPAEGEIEQVRADLKADIEQIRAELKANVEQIRAELHQAELRLRNEIEQVRSDLKLDIERLRTELARTKADLLKWIVPLMLGQVALIAALVKLL